MLQAVIHQPGQRRLLPPIPFGLFRSAQATQPEVPAARAYIEPFGFQAFPLPTG
jgi:hypothetical protein